MLIHIRFHFKTPQMVVFNSNHNRSNQVSHLIQTTYPICNICIINRSCSDSNKKLLQSRTLAQAMFRIRLVCLIHRVWVIQLRSIQPWSTQLWRQRTCRPSRPTSVKFQITITSQAQHLRHLIHQSRCLQSHQSSHRLLQLWYPTRKTHLQKSSMNSNLLNQPETTKANPS